LGSIELSSLDGKQIAHLSLDCFGITLARHDLLEKLIASLDHAILDEQFHAVVPERILNTEKIIALAAIAVIILRGHAGRTTAALTIENSLAADRTGAEAASIKITTGHIRSP
jgi:hypothetical protein